jgi:hypothetical protein
MTEHSKEWAQLRVGATVTLRDWRGDTVRGVAFLSPAGAWLAKMTSGTGYVFPIMPRELIAIEQGADEMMSRLKPGQAITLADWEGGTVKGRAQLNRAGIWECKDKDGARWLIEPYRLASIEEV